ncbi:MAG: magnesium transporter [Pirellulales bacterium]
MVNTLYLPELREYLAEQNEVELREFCTALHPARTAEFMEGLTASESWEVLKHAEPRLREQIFIYFDHDKQIELLEGQKRAEVASLIEELASDDRVDLIHELRPETVDELLPLVSPDVRRNIQRLRSYSEGTAGAVMSTEFARLPEALTAREALSELSRQAEHLETIYYIYVVDNEGHLRGTVTTRQLVSAIGKPDVRLGDLMETELIVAHVREDQEEVARKVARYDLLAIPVVDDELRMLGIVTHDDIIDVVREEAVEDVQRMAGVTPLDESYLRTHILTLSWKRGMWLAILFFTALFTASALKYYEERLKVWPWLIMFIPLIMSSGGNSGNQSATLIISAMSTGDVTLRDWLRVIRRELLVGLLLGGFLAGCGFLVSWLLTRNEPLAQTYRFAWLIVPSTLILVVSCGALFGSLLPMLFKRLGLDPALMSNPFVAGISDILAIVIYMTVASLLLG